MRVLEADCVEAMRGMDEASVDAVVCDPPYSLGFMGKAWDRNLNHGPWAIEALRVLKPGGHLLAFGGTRTYHRLACAIEDAGFEIRDCLVWMYGSGFPKSLDVSKAIDKAAGAEREVVGYEDRRGAFDGVERESLGHSNEYGSITNKGLVERTAAATPEAARWQGWGTALKPAHEPIVLARKPLTGTVAANVQAHGTGALNVDGCRVGTGEGGERTGEASAERRYTDNGSTDFAPTPGPRGGAPNGRWPANVALDPEAAAMLDEQSGESKSQGGFAASTGAFGGNGIYGTATGQATAPGYGDSGGASRFFYCAKASRAERNAGLEGFGERRGGGLQGTHDQSMLTGSGNERNPFARNAHPTVKPISLMRWLCRLVTPPGGTVLDPFTGSGTTGCAAVLEGFDFIGCEREAEYVAIAEARIAWWAEHRGREAEAVLADSQRSETERAKHEGAGQLGLELG